MHIQLKFFATLAAFMPENAHQYAITAGTTVGDLLDRTGVPPEKARLIFVNSVKSDLTTPLTDGDRVGIFPPVGGG